MNSSAQPDCRPIWEPIAALERPIFLFYTAYGVPIQVETSLDLIGHLPSPLIPGARQIPGVKRGSSEPGSASFQFARVRRADGDSEFQVTENGAGIYLSPNADSAVRTLESRIHHHVAASSPAAVFVHAGAIAWRGRVAVIPGRSHCGKSTLVAALVNAGAVFYSDEYAVIGLDGRVHAFPRALRLRADVPGTASAGWERDLCAPLDPLPIRWVLSLRYRAAATWEPEALTPGETLLALLENTVAVRRQSELTVKTLKAAIGPALGFESEHAEAAGAAEEIIKLLETDPELDTKVEKEETI